MGMTDPVADCFSRIRNALMAGHERTSMPYSRMKESILKVLEQEGFVGEISTETNSKTHKNIVVEMRYKKSGDPVLKHLARVSRPGLRVYEGAPSSDTSVRAGLGFKILSTSKGIMTDREAKEKNVGGEVVGEVW